jgi:hypothetical protein
MHVDRKVNDHRVLLTEKVMADFFQVFEGTVSEFAKHKALPYLLVYNVVHGRVKSISHREYRRIFGVHPPHQAFQRVDGEYFRAMVRLWTFLHGDATKKDLFRELHPGKKAKRTDYRMFTGETATVRLNVEQRMEQKFFDQGLKRSEIGTWIHELERSDHEARIPYEEVKPVLLYLKQVLHVGVNRLLNQSISRYESGQLRTVSKARYDRLRELKNRAETILRAGSRSQLENFRKEVTGRKAPLTSFAQIQDQLEFLEKYGTKSSRQYLGRSISSYQKGRLYRITHWRAEKISRDCKALINKKPEIPLTSLPEALLKQSVSALLSVLRLYLIIRLIEEDNSEYERLVLNPTLAAKEKTDSQRYTAMEYAPSALRMSRRAFDLMVAAHSDLFKEIAIYDGKWHVPDGYIEDLREKKSFLILKNKYELLARGPGHLVRVDRSEAHRAGAAQVSKEDLL